MIKVIVIKAPGSSSPSIDTRSTGQGTAISPGHNSYQLIIVVCHGSDQWPTGVSLRQSSWHPAQPLWRIILPDRRPYHHHQHWHTTSCQWSYCYRSCSRSYIGYWSAPILYNNNIYPPFIYKQTAMFYNLLLLKYFYPVALPPTQVKFVPDNIDGPRFDPRTDCIIITFTVTSNMELERLPPELVVPQPVTMASTPAKVWLVSVGRQMGLMWLWAQ